MRVHLVGIGGIGLSAIARVLAARGHQVSGSDLHATAITDSLAQEGIQIFIGHAAEQIGHAELVVISSAIPESNPEVAAARARGLPVLDRRAFLGQLMAGYRGIAVAGTHGKTTTSAMIAYILERTDRNPSFIVGGILADLGSNAQAGKSEWFVIEADEYGRMFHGLAPQIAVITHIEMDHPDCFADIDDMREAYGIFVQYIVPEGRLIACHDSDQVRQLLREIDQEVPMLITYGRKSGADYWLEHVSPNDKGGVDLTVSHQGAVWARCSLRIPGWHNALNATAALLAAEACGVPPQRAAATLSDFRGVLRRFELKGESGGITVIDDYAHHPTEIAATLAAARARYGNRRIWAVLQPHTYSRTETLLGEFASCFDDADHLIVTDIYAARTKEQPIIDVSQLVEVIIHPSVQHIGSLADVEHFLLEALQPGDVLITLGAGDGYLIGEAVLAAKERQST